MSMRYAGGIISATPPTVTTSSAKGMWTLSEQAQYKQQGVWPIAPPTTIGQAYGGGYYAGKISTTANGVATHYLIVSPAANMTNNKKWGNYNTAVAGLSDIDGKSNTDVLAALGANYEAALYCKGLNIGDYTDWYLPSVNELEVAYFNLKPTTTANNTSYGANPYAVSPEPVNTNHTSSVPAQTSAGINFRNGESEAFFGTPTYLSYITSNQQTAIYAQTYYFNDWAYGGMVNDQVSSQFYIRAMRKVPI